MVETRRASRLRSRSDLTESSAAAAANEESAQALLHDDPKVHKHKKNEGQDGDKGYSIGKESVIGKEKDNERETNQLNSQATKKMDTKQLQQEAKVLQRHARAKTSTRDNSNSLGKNELSKLIPGYTAPLKLTASSLDKYRPAGGLEDLRRQALRSDPTTAIAVAGSKPNQQHLNSLIHQKSSAHAAMKGGSRRRREAPDHAGDGWFRMRPTPLTDDVKKDLSLIRNRNYLDPKRFYKSADPAAKFLQVGTVVEGASEYYTARLTKKQRRTNLVEEVLADPSTAAYAQNKYRNMQREKTAAAEQRKKRRRKGRRGRR